MIKTTPVILESIVGHDIKEKELLSVIIDGKFKTVVFYKLDSQNYIIIGNTSAYNAACYWNNASVTGFSLIEGTGDWYETTEEESEAIFQQIVSTGKINKKGRPYYRFDITNNK